MKAKRFLALVLALGMAFSVLLPVCAAETGDYKNVIIMIGDGMGENHLNLSKDYGYELYMEEHCDLRGQSRTSSASHVTTDSAAGGTALASGVRIMNQTVGVYIYDPFDMVSHPRSILEAAKARGMRAGIVTTDKTTGATPASFSVHVLYRKQTEKIAQAQLKTNLDIIWGAGGDVMRAQAEENGWQYVTNKSEMALLQPGSRSFGQFASDLWRWPMPKTRLAPSLAQMTEKAIELLDNDEGFVLMVEGAHIDKLSHQSTYGSDYTEKLQDAANAVKGFDAAVQEAVEFARRDGHTIVVVTADHETGNLYYENNRYTYHSHEHTPKNVPLLVFGCRDLIADGKAVNNYTIPRLLAAKLGWEKSEFPKSDPGRLLRLVKNASAFGTK